MSAPNAPYDDGWFYADGEKPVGPVTTDDLNAVLRAKSDPSKVRVWRAGFPDWRETKDVPEFANQISRPPPLKPAPAPVAKQGDDEKAVQTNKRGVIASSIVLVIALIVGAVISSIAYGNSAYGIAYLIGQFLGASVILFVLTLPWRHATYTQAVVLAIATLSVGLSNTQKVLDGITAKEAQAALKHAYDPKQVEKALEANPSNALLQLTALASKEAENTKRLVEQLSAGIEPPSLNKDINHATITRSELEAYLRDLKLAESNASAAVPRYLALLKDERSRVETSARSLHVDASTIRSLLEGIDARHARTSALASKLLTAQGEFYRAYGNAIAILIEQSGNYKVDATGKFIFPSQSIANRYNAAAENLSRATNRMNELTKEQAPIVTPHGAPGDRDRHRLALGVRMLTALQTTL